MSTLAVVDPAGRLVGMVTADDLIGRDGTSAHDASEILTTPARPATNDNRRVGDVMNRNLPSVAGHAEEEEISCLMQKLEGVVVLDNGRLVGVMSRTDLLLRQLTSRIKARAETHHDDEAVRERIFAQIPCHLWARIEGVDIEVENGVARISGIVTDEAVRNELRIVEKVPGVTRFVDSLLISDPATGDLLP